MKLLAAVIPASAAALLVAGSIPAQQLESAVRMSQQMLEETSRSQQRIDQLDTQTQNLLNEYRAQLKQLEQLRRYNASQRRQIEAQEREIASLRSDINNISSLQRAIQPLMEDMLNGLERFVDADLPFLPSERHDRIARLQNFMEDPDHSAAQRYRLITEAYQIENEYGRTLEAYRGDVETGGVSYDNVEFLRIGRLALIFKTDDDAVLKIYHPEVGGWVDLDHSFLPHVKTGLRMAKEQIPPDFLTIPVTAPETAN